ncbi:TPA: hypothetical protein R1940_002518 [Staphylococcus delphini]|nr:hypothetical protein [Staphylococcus delphini]HEC2179137.1 hypothetical protein [Staphylococcus delphini]HEC2186380.1 hypothetical protein [Staphylococcus delphini]HEC2188923.1 hypothetical protein [Staphylococcus delphini]HEC2191368.1 hypothetical protein [Staphylococcus delphini]
MEKLEARVDIDILELDLYAEDISYIDNDINFVSTSTVSTESTALSGSCPTSSASTYSTASSVSG